MNKRIVSESPSGVFDAIAPAWYNFRHYSIFKAELEAMASRWRKGKLLNLGCGHGADFLPFKQGFELYGLDYSSVMLELAEKFSRKHNFKAFFTEADLRQLPYEEASFDYAIAIAAYHHLKGHTEQLQALIELKRVLKPGGEVFITVWNRSQPRFWFKPKEMLLPFRVGEKIFERYYYLFSYREIKKMAMLAGFSVLSIFPESRYHYLVPIFSRNICLLLKKTN